MYKYFNRTFITSLIKDINTSGIKHITVCKRKAITIVKTIPMPMCNNWGEASWAPHLSVQWQNLSYVYMYGDTTFRKSIIQFFAYMYIPDILIFEITQCVLKCNALGAFQRYSCTTYNLRTTIEISTRKQAQQSIHTAVDKLVYWSSQWLCSSAHQWSLTLQL
jgi:hypothetical protein